MKQIIFYRMPDGEESGFDNVSTEDQTDSSQLIAVDTVYVSPDGGTTNEAFPRQGVPYDFCVDIVNSGQLPSGPFFVRFTLSGDQDPPFEQDFQQEAGLDAGSSVKAVVNFGSFPNQFASYYLEACIYGMSSPGVPVSCAGSFEFAVNSESIDNNDSSTNNNENSNDPFSDDSFSDPSSGDSSNTGSDGALATPVNIHYDVFLVAQPDNCTCWAASSAMILSYWRDAESFSSNPPYTVQEIKDMVTSAAPQYDISCGLKPEDTQPVGDILNLSFDYPMCYGVDGFASLLQAKGPLVFIRASVGGQGAHAITIIGMYGDGTPDGTTVETLNPSPVGTGAAQNVSFTDLMTMMEQLGFWDQTDWATSGGLDRVYVMYRK